MTREPPEPVELCGLVTGAAPGRVTVHVTRLTACGSCRSAGACGSSVGGGNGIEFELNDRFGAREGDRVTFRIEPSGGPLRLSLLAYGLPLAVAVTAGLTTAGLTGSDLCGAAGLLAAGLAAFPLMRLAAPQLHRRGPDGWVTGIERGTETAGISGRPE